MNLFDLAYSFEVVWSFRIHSYNMRILSTWKICLILDYEREISDFVFNHLDTDGDRL